MKKLFMPYFLLLTATDMNMITDLRNFLFQFAVGTVDRESADMIGKFKYFMSSITLDYLKPYVHDHKKVFNLFRYIYTAEIITILPQYIIIIVLIFLYGTHFSFLYFIPIVVKTIILFSVRSQEDSNRRIVYRNYIGNESNTECHD